MKKEYRMPVAPEDVRAWQIVISKLNDRKKEMVGPRYSLPIVLETVAELFVQASDEKMKNDIYGFSKNNYPLVTEVLSEMENRILPPASGRRGQGTGKSVNRVRQSREAYLNWRKLTDLVNRVRKVELNNEDELEITDIQRNLARVLSLYAERWENIENIPEDMLPNIKDIIRDLVYLKPKSVRGGSQKKRTDEEKKLIVNYVLEHCNDEVTDLIIGIDKKFGISIGKEGLYALMSKQGYPKKLGWCGKPKL